MGDKRKLKVIVNRKKKKQTTKMITAIEVGLKKKNISKLVQRIKNRKISGLKWQKSILVGFGT